MNRTAIGVTFCLVWGSLGQLHAQQRVLDFTGRPVATLGHAFSSVTPGVELANGGFLLVDRVDNVVVLVDWATNSARFVGAAGAGPGEYRRPAPPISSGKGGAFIADEALGRALLLSGAGAIIGVAGRDDLGGASPMTVRGFDEMGRIFSYGRSPQATGDSLPIHRIDPATKIATTIAWWPQPRARLGAATRRIDGRVGRSIEQSAMWPPRTAWVVLPQGRVAIVTPDPYRVAIVEPSGAITRGPVVAFKPVKVTPAMRDAFRREFGPGTPDDMFPEVLLPFEGLEDVFPSPAGEIWVKRMLGPNDPVPVYDVFDWKGVRSREVRLRSNSKVVGVGRKTAYVARQDLEDGSWYLETYRIP